MCIQCLLCEAPPVDCDSEDAADHVPIGGCETPLASASDAGSAEEDFPVAPLDDDILEGDYDGAPGEEAAIWEAVLADNAAASEDLSMEQLIQGDCPFVVEMVQQAGDARQLVGAVQRGAGWKKVHFTPVESKEFIPATTRIQRRYPDSGVEGWSG